MRDFSIPGIARRPVHRTIKKPKPAVPASAFHLRGEAAGALTPCARKRRLPACLTPAYELDASDFMPFL